MQQIRIESGSLDDLKVLEGVDGAAHLATASRLTPMLCEKLRGNPRRIKRFLNDLNVRQSVAELRGIQLSADSVAKLMMLERLLPEDFEIVLSWLAKNKLRDQLQALPLTGDLLGRAYPVYASVADRIAKRIADLDPSLSIIERVAARQNGMGRDPFTGDPLLLPGHASVADGIAKRIADLDRSLGIVERAAAVAAIESEETASGTRCAVGTFDFTFSIPTSASALWAVADAGTQAIIADAHHPVVADVIAFMEREVAAPRGGATPGDGAVAERDVTGLIATAFDHYDSPRG